MKWDALEEEPCSLARTVAVIGDRWSLLILRECFLRIRRFDEFQSSLGVTRHLLADRALSEEAARYVLLDIPMGVIYAAIMFRLEDEHLRAIADEVIESLARSGELDRLYDKWFVHPIPGLAIPVGIPMSPLQREIFDAPGSEMLKM